MAHFKYYRNAFNFESNLKVKKVCKSPKHTIKSEFGMTSREILKKLQSIISKLYRFIKHYKTATLILEIQSIILDMSMLFKVILKKLVNSMKKPQRSIKMVKIIKLILQMFSTIQEVATMKKIIPNNLLNISKKHLKYIKEKKESIIFTQLKLFTILEYLTRKEINLLKPYSTIKSQMQYMPNII